MKALNVFILLIVFGNVSVQSLNFLTAYHPHPNKVEAFLIESNYCDALVRYDSALVNVDRGFMKDYFTAAVCAIYLNDADKTFYYLLKIASKGISLDFVKSEITLASIQRTNQWRNFELKYLEERRLFEEQLNITYQKEINTIVVRDQWFRNKNAETFADTHRRPESSMATGFNRYKRLFSRR
jgi:hypothetical protein